MNGERIVCFKAGGRDFALPARQVDSVHQVAEVAAVPGSPDAVAGLTSLRGRIVTLIDLARACGLDPAPCGGRFAVQLAEPLTHLAILVPGPIQTVQANDSLPETRGSGGAGPARAAGAPSPLGPEVILSGGRPALLLDPAALAELCSQKVRERFRVCEPFRSASRRSQ